MAQTGCIIWEDPSHSSTSTDFLLVAFQAIRRPQSFAILSRRVRCTKSGVIDAPRLHFYASAGTLHLAAKLLERNCGPAGYPDPQVSERLNLEIHQVEALQPFTIGRYRITAFPANHDPAVEPLLYAVESGGRSIFYGTDTAELPEGIWQDLHRLNLCFDIIILDHTYGPDENGGDHLSAHIFIDHVTRMRAEGLLVEYARALATHIAHEGNPPHPELAEFAAQNGYEIAFDGLTIQI